MAVAANCSYSENRTRPYDPECLLSTAISTAIPKRRAISPFCSSFCLHHPLAFLPSNMPQPNSPPGALSRDETHPHTHLQFPDSSHVPSFPESSRINPPPASTHYRHETFLYPTHPYPPSEERMNSPYNRTSFPPGMQQNAPPVPPLIPLGLAERNALARRWLATDNILDAVLLIQGIARHHGLQIPTVRAPPSASSAPSLISSTINAAPTLPDEAGIGHSVEIPMSYAAQTNSYPAPIAAEQPRHFPGLSIRHAATLPIYGGTHRLSKPAPLSNSSSMLPANPHYAFGHELQSLQWEHDTNAHPVAPAAAGAANTKYCSQCTAAKTPQWRRHPDSHAWLCNACGQKARKKNTRRVGSCSGSVDQGVAAL
ncbi:hypothetical protein C8J57DRAFT_1512047 [Mycena rebaudengoi]|nr:hypothetical protein C8J57DRAFT_1512047 [Mycena rebaudengoi]